MRLLSGVQPSGKLHLGNYFGAMRQHIENQSKHECFIFIANYHALTTIQDPKVLAEYTRDVAIDYLALGFDPSKALLFRQSDVPEVCELAWILSTVTGKGLLERAVSYKDKVAKGLSASMGLFSYPILQAADILIYRSHAVPVGKDQVQHIEMTADMAGYFHNTFNCEVFVLPKPMLNEAAIVPGVDGEKMSKSYGNTIEIFEERPGEEEDHGPENGQHTGGRSEGPGEVQCVRLAEAVCEQGGDGGVGQEVSRGGHGLWRRQEAAGGAL